MNRRIRHLALAALFLSCCSQIRAANVTLAGAGSIPADARDSEHETVGGMGSGGCYDAVSGLCYFTTNRGPSEGAIEYRPRFQSVEIIEPKDGGRNFQFMIMGSTLYRNEAGHPMTGLPPVAGKTDFPQTADGRTCISPASIALAPDGTLYVGDEYGPFIYQFNKKGRQLRVIKPPDHVIPHDALGIVDYGGGKKDVAWGRSTDRGFEALTLTPDGTHAVAILQSGLEQDGGKKAGVTRLFVFDLATGKAVSEYAYRFANAKELTKKFGLQGDDKLKEKNLSVGDMAALSPTTFLVLERDNRGQDGSAKPQNAVYKAIYKIDLAGATDLMKLPDTPFDLPPTDPKFKSLAAAEDIVPVTKEQIIDFASLPLNDVAMSMDQIEEKWGTLLLMPSPQSGKQRLVLASDNDFVNPILHIEGKDVPFPRALMPLPTQFLVLDVDGL